MARVPDLEKHPDLTEKVCSYIREGNTITDSCAAVGVGESTYYAWVERGKDANGKACYKEFQEATTRALAEAKAGMVRNVHNAGKEDWRASAHLLACRDPENYSIRRKYEHSGRDGKPIEVTTYSAINLPETVAEDEEPRDTEGDR